MRLTSQLQVKREAVLELVGNLLDLVAQDESISDTLTELDEAFYEYWEVRAQMEDLFGTGSETE